MSDHDAHAAAATGFHAPHAVPASLFVKVLLALVFLTVVTVAVSRVDFGSANLLVAMAIAAVKVSLVMTFFMHLKWDTAINQITIISSFMFLSLLFIFTLADYGTRGATDATQLETAPVPDHPEVLKRRQAHGSEEHGTTSADPKKH